MSEAAFPVLGAAFVLLVVLPISALLTKLVLVLLERGGSAGALDRLGLRYVLLTGSSALPLAWFMSAGIHQAESTRSAFACLVSHDEAGSCFEPAFFASLLAGGVLLAWLRATWQVRQTPVARSAEGEALSARLECLVERESALFRLRGRVL